MQRNAAALTNNESAVGTFAISKLSNLKSLFIRRKASMPHSMQRLRQLAGLHEDSLDIESADQASMAAYDAKEQRESIVAFHIADCFLKLGIAIAPLGVRYEEHPSKAVTVVLDDHPMGYDITALYRLQSSGLASGPYRVVSLDRDYLQIEFILDTSIYTTLGIT